MHALARLCHHILNKLKICIWGREGIERIFKILYTHTHPSFFGLQDVLPPTPIWEENRGASYSPNVAYLVCWGQGVGGGGRAGFFFPIFLL